MTQPYILRHMRLEDISQVVQVDELSFPTPWSVRTYQFEITNRETSHLIVLEAPGGGSPGQTGGLRTFFHRLRGPKTNNGTIIGYGGCWLIAGEAHISTIAVHPTYRGKNLGELLLAGMLSRAVRLEAEYSVLEVRVSNAPAQALYRKYEYEITGVRRGYYRDNGEDAYLMEVRPLDEAYRARLQQRISALRQQVSFIDQFTTT